MSEVYDESKRMNILKEHNESALGISEEFQMSTMESARLCGIVGKIRQDCQRNMTERVPRNMTVTEV